MQPIHSVMQPMAPPGASGLFQPQQPETGAFDFMSYLLGLQASPIEGLLSEGSPLPAGDAARPNREGKDPLLAVLAAAPQAAAQVTSPLSPMEPAKTAAAVPTMLSAAPIGAETPKGLPNPTVETALRSLSGDAKPSLSRVVSDTAMNPPPPFVLAGDGGMALDGPTAAPDLSGVKKYAAAANAKAAGPMKAETEAASPFERPQESRPQSEVARESATDALRPEFRITREEALPEEIRKETSHRAPVAFSAQMSRTESGLVEMENVSAPAAASARDVTNLPEVTERIQTLVYNGGGEMTVALDPPDLGKLEIKVSTRGNRVEVEMKSENQGAKQALESHFADLQSALESQDLRLSRLEVQVNRETPTGFSLHGNHSDGAHQGRAHGDSGQQGRSWSGGAPVRRAEPESVPSIQAARRPAHVAGSGRVDLRV